MPIGPTAPESIGDDQGRGEGEHSYTIYNIEKKIWKKGNEDKKKRMSKKGRTKPKKKKLKEN